MKKLLIILIFIIMFGLNSNIVYAADTTVASNISGSVDTRNGLWGPYWIDVNTATLIYSSTNDNPVVASTTDGGATWNTYQIRSSSIRNLSAWFDQDTPGDTGTLIHFVYTDTSGADAFRYFNVDVDGGAISEEVIRNPTAVSASYVALTKTVSGNLIATYISSTDSSSGTFRSSTSTESWVSIADVWDAGNSEHLILFPAATADDDDAVGILWNFDIDEIELRMYDESANTWTTTGIEGNMIEDAGHINMDASVRHSDSHILLTAHSNDDTAGDDLLTWDLTVDSIASPATTSKANIFTDQNQSAQAAMIINQQNDDIYVAYLKGGAWTGTVDVVYHKSDDGMATWGSELTYSEAAQDDNRRVSGTRTIGDNGGRIQWSWYNDDLLDIYVNLVNDIEIFAAPSGAKVIRLLGNVRLRGIRLH